MHQTGRVPSIILPSPVFNMQRTLSSSQAQCFSDRQATYVQRNLQ